MIEDLVGFIV